MFGTHFYISRWPPWPTEGKLQDVPFKKNYYLKNKDLFFFPTSTDKKVEQAPRGDYCFPWNAPQNMLPWQISSSLSRKCTLQHCTVLPLSMSHPPEG